MVSRLPEFYSVEVPHSSRLCDPDVIRGKEAGFAEDGENNEHNAGERSHVQLSAT